MADKLGKLPVIFRAERAGDFKGHVTAVFPTEPWDSAGRLLTTYAHVGQHGGGDFGWYSATRAAKPDEYAALLAELRSIYGTDFAGEGTVDLVVYQRMTPQHRAAFRANGRG